MKLKLGLLFLEELQGPQFQAVGYDHLMHHLGDILNHKEITEQEERGVCKGRKKARVRHTKYFQIYKQLQCDDRVLLQRWQVLLPGTRDMDVGQGNGLRQRGQSHGQSCSRFRRHTCYPGLSSASYQPCVLSEDHLRS